jgi:lipopolysaccharide transport system permease protein
MVFPILFLPMLPCCHGLILLNLSMPVVTALWETVILLLPVFILMAMATALGAGLWLSALNVQYRDIRFTLSFLVQFWFFATPVVYPSSLVPGMARFFYGLNPMVGVIEGFRGALLGKGQIVGPMFVVSIILVALLLITGCFYFRRMEKGFADVV